MTQMDLQHRDYTVGWICALPIEFAASKVMLDIPHTPLSQDDHDHNSYAFGCIGNHNVVIACLPSGENDTTSAASVLNDMRRSFKYLRFCLMVGIGGAVPCTPKDIRLGDIFVSNPDMTSGGVIQYDAGKIEREGIFVLKGSLNMPPKNLRTAITALRADHEIFDPKFPGHLEIMFKNYKKMAAKYGRPDPEMDILFDSSYDHANNDQDCSRCDNTKRKPRRTRDSEPVVHYGLIASANKIMKHGATRDQLWNDHKIECFETEAAGLMNSFQCLVVRGISDYADSHKNDIWKPYAAAVAAAYTKELLMIIPTQNFRQMPAMNETNNDYSPAAQGVATLPISRPHVPSTAIRTDVVYRLKNFNSRMKSVDIDDSFPKRDDDVQITLASDNQSRTGQYWAFQPNRNAEFWTLFNMALPQMALDVYGDNKAHPRLASTQHVSGQQWQAVDRGDGAVSLWNNYSGRGMYLCSSDSPATPTRLMLADRDDKKASQLWFLVPVEMKQQQNDHRNKMIANKAHDEITIEDVTGKEEEDSTRKPQYVLSP